MLGFTHLLNLPLASRQYLGHPSSNVYNGWNIESIMSHKRDATPQDWNKRFHIAKLDIPCQLNVYP